MKLLIDTHIAIWAMAVSDKLPEEFVKKITDLNNTVYVSIVSVWEVAIKNMKNNKQIPINEKEFVDTCNKMEFEIMPLKLAHIMNLRNLKMKDENISHKDPFDRIMIAQCEYENMEFWTRDEVLKNYDYEKIYVV